MLRRTAQDPTFSLRRNVSRRLPTLRRGSVIAALRADGPSALVGSPPVLSCVAAGSAPTRPSAAARPATASPAAGTPATTDAHAATSARRRLRRRASRSAGCSTRSWSTSSSSRSTTPSGQVRRRWSSRSTLDRRRWSPTPSSPACSNQIADVDGARSTSGSAPAARSSTGRGGAGWSAWPTEVGMAPGTDARRLAARAARAASPHATEAARSAPLIDDTVGADARPRTSGSRLVDGADDRRLHRQPARRRDPRGHPGRRPDPPRARHPGACSASSRSLDS